MTAPSFHTTQKGRRLAYHLRPGTASDARPGLVFLGGFRSDMTGTKAQYLEQFAAREGLSFLRFDYSGHGQSSGRFEEGAIGDWCQDAGDILAAKTSGAQILVGSSMGGWIALLLAKRLSSSIAGLVGIAAAPDFTEDSMWAGFDSQARETLMRDGQVAVPSEYSDEPYVITRRLIEEGRTQLVLREALNLPFPVRLLHGSADADVPLSVPLRLMAHATCADLRLTVVKDEDHRFSSPEALALTAHTIQDILVRNEG